MANLKRSVLIPFVVLALCLLAGYGAAQPEQPVDPWQFPKLTNSKPFQRWWWAFQQRAYPLGEIPESAKLRALQEIEQSKAALASPSQPVQSGRWSNIGPAPILGIFGGSSGRTAAIAVHPANSNHWLIGAAQGGIWETLDTGTTWTPKTDDQAALAMGAIAFAPSNPSLIYAGTGEANFSGDSYAGAGLLKSTDGGTTWQILATSTFAKTTFSDIKVHPTNPNIILAATTFGSAGRDGASPPSTPARGLFKSTDGGVTWSQKLNGEATDLEVDPSNFNNQYAGIGNIFGSSLNGVYRSTDTGGTWTLISGPWSTMSGGVGRVELAVAPSNSNVLYVSIQDAFDGVGNDGELLGIWRTNNAWAPTPSWTQIPSPIGSGDQLWYDHEIIVDPTIPDTLYLGTTPLFKFNGITWTDVTNGIHVDQHSMAWAGTRLIVGNDGGVWSTADGGNNWTDHNTNLAITQFYDGSIHPTNPNFALAGSQDNGTEKWTGTDAWQEIFGGDGADNAISSSDPNNDWAVSFQNLGIRRTTNGGASFTVADSGIDKTGVPFIARFEKCPANDNVFIAGTDNIWRSNNFFSAITPTWSDNLSGNFSSGVSALAFAPSDSSCNTYAFGTGAGSLRLTANGGSTWVNIDVGNAVPNRAVTDLAFDPTNANILYVTLSGFDEGTPGQPGHVFKTTNALAASPTWSNVSPPVNIPHNTIVLDPFDPTIVYVGTDLGVWKSTNGGGTWTQMGPETGMPNVAVFELQINHTTNRLIAFTHGRGAFLGGGANTAPFGFIDTPAPGATVQGTLNVEGWVLDKEDSSLTVELLVDGTAVSSSPTRFSRPDVCAAFPSVSHCSSSNPGVRFSWNTTTVSNGTYTLAFRVTDPQGASATVGSRTVTVNNPANTAPFGYIDVPAPGATVQGTTNVEGWVLDQEDSSLTVELLVDSSGISSSPTRFARPDVCGAFPSISHCSSSNPGVRFSWNTTTVSNGTHTLALRVTDPQGASATVGSRTVTVNNPANTAPFGYVDVPAPGATVQGTLEVVGWVLDQEDSSLTVELLVDGTAVSSSPTRFSRPDVCAAFPSVSHCSSSNPGVRFSWNTTTVSNGAHTLALRVTDPKGASATVGSRSVTVNNP